MVGLSFDVLSTKLKDSEMTLIEKLIQQGAISEVAVMKVGIIEGIDNSDIVDVVYADNLPEGISWNMTKEDIKNVYKDKAVENYIEEGLQVLEYETRDGSIRFFVTNRGLVKIIHDKFTSQVNNTEFIDYYLAFEERLVDYYGFNHVRRTGSAWGGNFRAPKPEQIQQIFNEQAKESVRAVNSTEYTVLDGYAVYGDRKVDGSSSSYKLNYYDIEVRFLIRKIMGLGDPPYGEWDGREWLKNDSPDPDVIREMANAVEINSGIRFVDLELDEELDEKSKAELANTKSVKVNRSALPREAQSFNEILVSSYGPGPECTITGVLEDGWFRFKYGSVSYNENEEYPMMMHSNLYKYIILYENDEAVGYMYFK